MAAMETMIKVEGIKKSFGEVKAVKGIDFYVEKGKLFAFLGPNGAGKSTTIDILCTLLQADDGRVEINGHLLGKEDDAIRSKIGIVFQDSLLDALLTVRENLEIRAGFYGLKGGSLKNAVEMAAKAADITDFTDRPYGKLSGGQRRRADIARALVNTPELLFLDEPTTGLDPKTKEEVWKTITELQKKTGMTVFLTTHYMEEAAGADYIVLINQGKIAAKGTPYELKERYSSDVIRLKPRNAEALRKSLREMKVNYTEKNDLLTVRLAQTADAIPILTEMKSLIESFEVLHGSMNDVFLNITGGIKNNDTFSGKKS